MTDYDAYDHRDIQATCLDIDITGRRLVLAGRKYVAITDASDPEKTNFKCYRKNNKSDINCIKFCPRIDNCNQLAAASSQSFEIYNIHQNGIQMIFTNKAHSRHITDIDWDHFNSYQFATCSADDTVNIWDVRDLKRTALSWNIIAGAFQIKWSRKMEHIFATAHEGDIRLWDTRKGSMPIQFIAAHLSKILSFDWSSKCQFTFVSSSFDKTVKVFDFTKPTKPEISFNTNGPMLRARFALFGDAIFTTPFTQVGRSDQCVTLWNVAEGTPPGPSGSVVGTAVHTFGSHPDLIFDFCQRSVPRTMPLVPASDPESSDESAVQLYTLCKDNTLRLWTIDSKLQSLCHRRQRSVAMHQPSISNTNRTTNFLVNDLLPNQTTSFDLDLMVEEAERAFVVNRSGSTDSQLQNESSVSGSTGGDLSRRAIVTSGESGLSTSFLLSTPIDWPRQLMQLHSAVIGGDVVIDEIDHESNLIKVAAESHRYVVKMHIYMPALSPNKIESITSGTSVDSFNRLSFKFLRESTTLPNSVKLKILKQMQDVCTRTFTSNESVLEACLKELAKCLESYMTESESSETQPSTGSPSFAVPSLERKMSYVLSRVPFPATCLARFCSSGTLVCFARAESNNFVQNNDEFTLPSSCTSVNGMNETNGIYGGSAHQRQISPRSYSELCNMPRDQKALLQASSSYLIVPPGKDRTFSLKDYYFPNRSVMISRKKHMIDNVTGSHYSIIDKSNDDSDCCSNLIVYDCSGLFPFSRELAKAYKIDESNPLNSCLQNENISAAANRPDLSKVWKIVGRSVQRNLESIQESDFAYPWALHPFGRRLVNSFIDHYCRSGDIQTAALICCVLGSRIRRPKSKYAKALAPNPTNVTSNYNTIHGTYGLMRESYLAGSNRQRSGSFSEDGEQHHQRGGTHLDGQFQHDLLSPIVEVNGSSAGNSTMVKTHEPGAQNSITDHFRLLDPTQSSKHETIIMAYADLLYRWRFFNERSVVLQYTCCPPEWALIFGSISMCKKCGKENQSTVCGDCKSFISVCVVCNSPVKGLVSTCLLCGHGGHTPHMIAWFAEHGKCPANCGCCCTFA